MGAHVNIRKPYPKKEAGRWGASKFQKTMGDVRTCMLKEA
jgi:hypothetical protein